MYKPNENERPREQAQENIEILILVVVVAFVFTLVYTVVTVKYELLRVRGSALKGANHRGKNSTSRTGA